MENTHTVEVREEVSDALLKVAEYAFNTGEMWKAYLLLSASPVLTEESPEIEKMKARVKKKLDDIANFQNEGKRVSGFIDPPDVTKKPCYMFLKEKLEARPEVHRLVDVGCFTGWLGRNLGIWGYRVHGIDLSPMTLEVARYMSVGTPATFEVLEGTKLGQKYPKEYDGAVLFDVVEHVFDPTLLLASVEASLKDGGWVFIHTPKPDFEHEIENYGKPDEVKEHIRVFTPAYVKELFSGKKEIVIAELLDEYDCKNWFITYKV
jgi:2-polyprenyl-3-methyl-5-hydroxy-6-metoxy-1,4-benzoquinol methylase